MSILLGGQEMNNRFPKVVNVHLTSMLKEIIDREAARREQTASEYMRQALLLRLKCDHVAHPLLTEQIKPPETASAIDGSKQTGEGQHV
jgi:hypothetical protein